MARFFRSEGCEVGQVDWESVTPNLKEQACSILITCGHPKVDGKMSVEMTYDGDPTLAAFLLESAQGYLEDEENFSN